MFNKLTIDLTTTIWEELGFDALDVQCNSGTVQYQADPYAGEYDFVTKSFRKKKKEFVTKALTNGLDIRSIAVLVVLALRVKASRCTRKASDKVRVKASNLIIFDNSVAIF